LLLLDLSYAVGEGSELGTEITIIVIVIAFISLLCHLVVDFLYLRLCFFTRNDVFSRLLKRRRLILFDETWRLRLSCQLFIWLMLSDLFLLFFQCLSRCFFVILLLLKWQVVKVLRVIWWWCNWYSFFRNVRFQSCLMFLSRWLWWS